MEDKDLKDALYKKAVGFLSDEVVEEYSLDEHGNSLLNKKKKKKKYNPPDINAVKILLEQKGIFSDEKLSHMTLSELKKEKRRLLKLLKEEKDEN